MTDKEINEQFAAKVRRGIFKPVARFLTNRDTAEDRLQDALGRRATAEGEARHQAPVPA